MDTIVRNTPFVRLPKRKNHKGYDTDKSVNEMLKDWDIVTCWFCGKRISMLDGRMINNGQHFVCKEH